MNAGLRDKLVLQDIVLRNTLGVGFKGRSHRRVCLQLALSMPHSRIHELLVIQPQPRKCMQQRGNVPKLKRGHAFPCLQRQCLEKGIRAAP